MKVNMKNESFIFRAQANKQLGFCLKLQIPKMNDNQGYNKLVDDFRGSEASQKSPINSKNATPKKSAMKKYNDTEDNSLKMPLLIMEKSHSQAYKQIEGAKLDTSAFGDKFELGSMQSMVFETDGQSHPKNNKLRGYPNEADNSQKSDQLSSRDSSSSPPNSKQNSQPRQSESMSSQNPQFLSNSSRKKSVDLRNPSMRKNTVKNKLLTNLERRITSVKQEEYLRKRDVTLEEKRALTIYTSLNVIAFIIQVIVLTMVQIFKNFDTHFIKLIDTPVSITKGIFLSEILLIVVLEILFVILPLRCFRCFGARQHFQNILMLKVKWCFALQCLFQTAAIMSFTLSEEEWFNRYPVNFAAFFFLKIYIHYFGYRRVKYLDDGRDYVSFKEFLAIHVTFSVLNCWITYFVIFNFFQFVKIWNGIERFNEYLEYAGIVAMVVIMFETTVYLAYYKDVIFAMVALLNYIGMYIHNYDEEKLGSSLPQVLHAQIILISLTGLFIIVTILHDFDKAFYQQYRRFFGKFQQEIIDSQDAPNSKPTPAKKNGPAEAPQRSQSFAVWLQFQDIQRQKKNKLKQSTNYDDDIMSEEEEDENETRDPKLNPKNQMLSR